ncbi:MAG: hypothetical protein Q7N50_06555 [Armatimonadota bacterium]|nr:hypothetical protein [Armatimonadota bacterium]
MELLVGLIFGPLGILIAVCSKGKYVNCPFCRRSVDPKALVCPYCQRDIVDRARFAIAPETK